MNLFCLRQKTELVDGIKIHGRSEFFLRTREALELLRPTPFFPDIQRYIAVIRQGRRSGMKVYAKRPTFVVGQRTWSHSALWYAGALAHDCYHSKLYHDARANAAKDPPADCWTGSDAEKKCLEFQIKTLQALNADAETVAYLKKLEKNPTYHGHNRGWKSWRDYWTRRW
ncbi:MAG TPA: hypothetical protein VGL11_06655 [Candidatus Binatia bacterium]